MARLTMASGIFIAFVGLFLSRFSAVESHYIERTLKSDPVNVTLYHEYLCPYCKIFIDEQLKTAYEQVGEIMHAEVFSFGNAKATPRPDDEGYIISCQHGDRECLGNALMECGRKYLTDYDQYLNFVFCMEENSFDPLSQAEKCAPRHTETSIVQCGTSKEGEELLYQMGLQQDGLNPPLEYVPWILINGVHNRVLQRWAQTDLVSLVCKKYEGNKLPEACGTSKQNLQVTYADM